MEALPGQRLLVGLTYVGPEAAVLRRRQFLGEVVAPGPEALPGLHVRAAQGDVLVLPADPTAILLAPRGDYRCIDTGEVFVDPDWLTSWRVTVTGGAAESWEANYAPLVRSIVPDDWELNYRHDAAHLRRQVEAYAGAYLGQRVEVALQVYEDGEAGSRFLGEETRAGRISRISYGEGIVLALDTGKEFRLPPDLALLQPAPMAASASPARPDLLTRWTVFRSPEDDEG